jgi:ornithine cyclodeaminase/alanine dehydrogenase-like protein (mu-crystallin family)
LATRLLGADDLSQLVRRVGRDELMDLMIDRLRSRFAQHDPAEVQARDRDGFRYDKPALGLLEWMPTHEVGGPVVIKMVGYNPTNPLQRRLPSVIATSSMWDTETGHLLAITDATLLTAVRTGAASGIATDILARPGPVTVGVVGLGAQAVTQLHAVSRVRPIERVIAIDVDEEVAASFPRRVAFLDADVRPWLHVNAVGADFPGKTELPETLLRRAFVVPDVLTQCLAEGECQQLPTQLIGPELADVVARAGEHRARRDEVTVFDSTGWAVEDDVALRLALELATEHGLGTDIELECLPADPHDPYHHAG